ncbi:hypothetical protein [Sphingobium sp. Sx8-8]|uniref:hypothetical protein n=1 Tax=Sphingobium sp. Sx8-8 TaxID=2933617 RepID=UPI001F57C9F5|nr:hypothetical protein [Sphingobium sp. Sx8-8]
MRNRTNLLIPILGLLLLASVPSSAFEIGSGSKAKASYDLHETFTLAARQCVEEAGGNEPADCSGKLDWVLGQIRKAQPKDKSTEAYAARWPDDPVRMLDRDPSKIRFGIKLMNDCATAMHKGPAIDDVGLLCSSHFGRLQFMHAQMLSSDAGGPQEPRALAVAWASFAFDAATDRNFRRQSYCGAVKSITHPGLKQALTFRDDSWCADRTKRKGWKVATLFALNCPNPLQEVRCWEKTGEPGDDLARMAARGAVVHLIQDSFSQAHVARVALGDTVPRARGPFVARIMCQRAVAWYDYNIQNLLIPDDEGHIVPDAHGVADHPPEGGTIKIDPACRSVQRLVDDPVTASARALWFIDRAQRARSEGATDESVAAIRHQFINYLETSVFPA